MFKNDLFIQNNGLILVARVSHTRMNKMTTLTSLNILRTTSLCSFNTTTKPISSNLFNTLFTFTPPNVSVRQPKRRFRAGILAMAAPGPGPVHKSEEEWQAILSPEQFRILRQKGTEYVISPFNFYFLSMRSLIQRSFIDSEIENCMTLFYLLW